MSLRYIIDAYNIINHPIFKQAEKDACSCQMSLIKFIRNNRLTGSPRNKAILVFDGYPPAGRDILEQENMVLLFSRKISADEKIKRLIEESCGRSEIVVVSNDRQVQLCAAALSARYCSIEEFTVRLARKSSLRGTAGSEAEQEKVSFAKMQRINEELRIKWLKE